MTETVICRQSLASCDPPSTTSKPQSEPAAANKMQPNRQYPQHICSVCPREEMIAAVIREITDAKMRRDDTEETGWDTDDDESCCSIDSIDLTRKRLAC